MQIDSSTIVSVSEANQNFSRVTRIADNTSHRLVHGTFQKRPLE